MSAKEKLLEFVHHAGELFGFEEFGELDLELDVERTDDPVHPLYFTDLSREEEAEVYRFCLAETPGPLEEMLPGYFELFRELEESYADQFESAVLLVKNDDENPDFFYLYRIESGEVGLFHSDLSIEDEEDEDEDGEDSELDEDHRNGHEL
jgi:hypothetical protein